VTIHSDRPFVPPEGERDPVRRVRGRMPAPVTVWTTGSGASRAGLTVSSVLVADGEPPRVLALVDEDSDFWDSAPERVVVSLLGAEHRFLAEAFAGTAPAPGGPFRLAAWNESEWGPVLQGAAGWLGVRLVDEEPRHVGWGLLLEGVVEHAEVGDADPLMHLRGRYRDTAAMP
jgi:flavin reductase (DIM6/NTAB) family NADH-FMN oxidoreductase RutF